MILYTNLVLKTGMDYALFIAKITEKGKIFLRKRKEIGSTPLRNRNCDMYIIYLAIRQTSQNKKSWSS